MIDALFKVFQRSDLASDDLKQLSTQLGVPTDILTKEFHQTILEHISTEIQNFYIYNEMLKMRYLI